jgi:DNA-directed RNA polymerase specialized sigma24 family protein
VDVAHLSAITVARDILKIEAVRSADARVILMALAYPNEPQEVIASLCGVSTRTVKRTLARWKQEFSWIENLVDLRCAIAPRRGGRVLGSF